MADRNMCGTERPCLFSSKELKAEESLSFVDKDSHLFFVLSGEVVVVAHNADCKRVRCNQFAFICPQYIYAGKVVEDARILTIDILPSLQVHGLYPLDSLRGECSHITKYRFQIYEIKHVFQLFLNYVYACLKYDIVCHSFDEWKLGELFLHLHKCYTRSELASLFYPVVSKTFDFKTFVLSNYRRVKSVNEFAALAHCSLSTFKRRFVEEMHEVPGKWLTDKRKIDILEKLKSEDKSFAELSEDFHFSSRAHFSTFCKKHFGKTPQMLQAELRSYNKYIK